MTLASDGFLSSSDSFLLLSSPPSSSQPAMHPSLGAHPCSPDLWSPYYTPNHCTSTHDPTTLNPTCIWGVSPPNLALSTEHFKLIYPSPPPTDSDPKHTVPLPALSEAEDSSHAPDTSACPQPGTLTPTPLTQDPEGPLTSHPSSQDLPLSPPPSLPMVPHALPEATASCCTLAKLTDAHNDADVETDAADGESQSSSSPEEPPSSDLLTPLSPMWDLPLDDADPRPSGTLEVSTLLSRSLVSPFSRLSTSGVQAAEGDRMTLPCGTGASIRDLDSNVESQCGLLRPPLVVPPEGLASARFSMFHSFFPSPNFDALSSDGFLGHSPSSSGGKLFVDPPPFNLFLPDPANPHVLPQLTLAQPWQFRRRISLPPPSPEDLATDSRDTSVSQCHGIGTSTPFGATLDLSHCASFAPLSHKGTESNVVTPNLFSQEARCFTLDEAPPSPLLGLGQPSFRWLGTSAIAGSGPIVSSDPGPMRVDAADSSEYAPLDLDQDVVPSSPVHCSVSDPHDDDDDFEGSSVPLSPSRRSFTDLPEEDASMNESSTSPPQSPLLAGQPLLTLPGAEPDNSLITAEGPVSDWPAASPPRGSGLGLFLPIQAASSNQAETSETHAIEPNLNFSSTAIARVDAREFEKLKSVRRRTWVSERKAKEDEVLHAKRAEYLAGRLSVAPPVPSKLADFDERGGVSAGADADETEAPPAEAAQLDESDEKTIRTWLLYTEARRAEARRVRKREKERGRELQALLRLKLGEDPDATERAGSTGTGSRGVAAKVVKPGKTAIVSMPQLVARMIMKRRDTPRAFSPRKHDSPYIYSPLSRFDCDRNWEREREGGGGDGGLFMVRRHVVYLPSNHVI
ncbi:hypothetical protein BJV74DRAFT_953885 [Russula compacta]|nr:hypothetical protein BJV74DRAFT_953885 [Russula compacta]